MHFTKIDNAVCGYILNQYWKIQDTESARWADTLFVKKCPFRECTYSETLRPQYIFASSTGHRGKKNSLQLILMELLALELFHGFCSITFKDSVDSNYFLYASAYIIFISSDKVSICDRMLSIVRVCVNNFFKQHLLLNHLADFDHTSQESPLHEALPKLFKS